MAQLPWDDLSPQKREVFRVLRGATEARTSVEVHKAMAPGLQPSRPTVANWLKAFFKKGWVQKGEPRTRKGGDAETWCLRGMDFPVQDAAPLPSGPWPWLSDDEAFRLAKGARDKGPLELVSAFVLWGASPGARTAERALALARHLAQTPGRSVLLLDLDLAHPGPLDRPVNGLLALLDEPALQEAPALKMALRSGRQAGRSRLLAVEPEGLAVLPSGLGRAPHRSPALAYWLDEALRRLLRDGKPFLPRASHDDPSVLATLSHPSAAFDTIVVHVGAGLGPAARCAMAMADLLVVCGPVQGPAARTLCRNFRASRHVPPEAAEPQLRLLTDADAAVSPDVEAPYISFDALAALADRVSAGPYATGRRYARSGQNESLLRPKVRAMGEREAARGPLLAGYVSVTQPERAALAERLYAELVSGAASPLHGPVYEALRLLIGAQEPSDREIRAHLDRWLGRAVEEPDDT